MELLKLNELTKRKLEETYVVIYAIKNEVNIKKADIIKWPLGTVLLGQMDIAHLTINEIIEKRTVLLG